MRGLRWHVKNGGTKNSTVVYEVIMIIAASAVAIVSFAGYARYLEEKGKL